MDVRTPALILLCSLLAAISLSVLGLAADNVAYVNKHHDEKLTLHYLRWNQATETQFSYWVQIDYLPSRFSMGRINAMLGASVVSAIIAIVVAIISWKARGDKPAQAGITLKNKKRSVSLLPVALALASIAFAIILGVAIFAWYPVMQWSIDFKKSLPLPPSVSGADAKSVKYQSPFGIGPDVWNCWVSDYVVDPALAGRLRTLCNEANVAKDLMLPLIVLSAALVVVVGLSWLKVKRTAAATPEMTEKDAEEISI